MNAILIIVIGIVGALYLIGRRQVKAPARAPEISPGKTPLETMKGPPAVAVTGWNRPDLLILIDEICDEEGYDRPALVKAIASVESSFEPHALNTKDRPPSVGIMGVKVPTARAYVATVGKIDDLYDPPTNIRAGVRFLKDLERKWLDSYGLQGVIQMYNLGETRFLQGERSAAYLSEVTRRMLA